MNLRPSDIKKLEAFLERVSQETYPEPESDLHSRITKEMFKYFLNNYPLAKGSKVLDVGCGQGVALRLFKKYGYEPFGVTLNSEDFSVCNKKGFQVFNMDQSFLDFDDSFFDFIWCRHVLEHSIFPYFTLNELYRVLKPDSFIYIEVPSPESNCHHERNINHYSVLGKSMWFELFNRISFSLVDAKDLVFDTPLGTDIYWAFLLVKKISL